MKHAFLIITHNEPYILDVLLSKLQHPDNTCFVHIDKKVKGKELMHLSKITNKWGGVICNTIDVRWGDYSQIQCELELFEATVNYPVTFDYYHLISGVDLPIQPMSYIHQFFEHHPGKLFFRLISDSANQKQIFDKTNYYYFFMFFSKTAFGKLLDIMHIPGLTIKIQKVIGVSRCKHDHINLYKGDQWCSLPHDAVEYLLAHKNYIRKRFRFTNCPDEIYKQTVLMNSPFQSQVFQPETGTQNAALREIDWKRGTPYVWRIEDKEFLTNSSNIFARKFSSQYKEIIDYIKEI